MRYVYGERIGETASLAVGCSAMVLDESRGAILLIKRTDNDRWCFPAGGMEPGESPEECAVRETREETGLDVEVVRLVGVYSSPNVISEYADGNRYQVLGLCFEAKVVGGVASVSGESSEVRFVPLSELENLDLMEPHRALIQHERTTSGQAFFRYLPP